MQRHVGADCVAAVGISINTNATGRTMMMQDKYVDVVIVGIYSAAILMGLAIFSLFIMT